jgi:hypothetical protein
LRLGLIDCGRGLSPLILERLPLQLGDHLALTHRIALGHRHRVHAARDKGADLDVFVGHGDNRPADDELVDDRLPRHRRRLGDDGRDFGGLGLFFLGALAARGETDQPRKHDNTKQDRLDTRSW